MRRKAVEMDRVSCWNCKKTVLTGNNWGFVPLVSKSCTMLMLPSTIMYVLEILMDFEDNTNAGEIAKLQMNLFLSRFNKSVKYVGVGFFGVCILNSLQY